MKNYRIHTMLFLVFGSTLWSATPTSNAKFLKPAEAIAKMTVPEGFEVKAYVAEPDIGEAIAFCLKINDPRAGVFLFSWARSGGESLTPRGPGPAPWAAAAARSAAGLGQRGGGARGGLGRA